MHVMREDGRAPGENVMGEFDGTWAVRESLFEKVPLKLRPAGWRKMGGVRGQGSGRGAAGPRVSRSEESVLKRRGKMEIVHLCFRH